MSRRVSSDCRLRAAVPMLAKASKVYLATVAEQNAKVRYDLPPVEGAEYLSRHGIASEIVEIPQGEANIPDTLVSAAQTRKCGYLVMGAYGHSRFRESILGGATRNMLELAEIPVLLAH